MDNRLINKFRLTNLGAASAHVVRYFYRVSEGNAEKKVQKKGRGKKEKKEIEKRATLINLPLTTVCLTRKGHHSLPVLDPLLT